MFHRTIVTLASMRSLIYFSAIVERRITRLALSLHILQLWTLDSDDLFEIECSSVGLGLVLYLQSPHSSRTSLSSQCYLRTNLIGLDRCRWVDWRQ